MAKVRSHTIALFGCVLLFAALASCGSDESIFNHSGRIVGNITEMTVAVGGGGTVDQSNFTFDRRVLNYTLWTTGKPSAITFNLTFDDKTKVSYVAYKNEIGKAENIIPQGSQVTENVSSTDPVTVTIDSGSAGRQSFVIFTAEHIASGNTIDYTLHFFPRENYANPGWVRPWHASNTEVRRLYPEFLQTFRPDRRVFSLRHPVDGLQIRVGLIHGSEFVGFRELEDGESVGGSIGNLGAGDLTLTSAYDGSPPEYVNLTNFLFTDPLIRQPDFPPMHGFGGPRLLPGHDFSVDVPAGTEKSFVFVIRSADGNVRTTNFITITRIDYTAPYELPSDGPKPFLQRGGVAAPGSGMSSNGSGPNLGGSDFGETGDETQQYEWPAGATLPEGVNEGDRLLGGIHRYKVLTERTGGPGQYGAWSFYNTSFPQPLSSTNLYITGVLTAKGAPFSNLVTVPSPQHLGITITEETLADATPADPVPAAWSQLAVTSPTYDFERTFFLEDAQNGIQVSWATPALERRIAFPYEVGDILRVRISHVRNHYNMPVAILHGDGEITKLGEVPAIYYIVPSVTPGGTDNYLGFQGGGPGGAARKRSRGMMYGWTGVPIEPPIFNRGRLEGHFRGTTRAYQPRNGVGPILPTDAATQDWVIQLFTDGVPRMYFGPVHNAFSRDLMFIQNSSQIREVP
jgi:hypothetical protein